MDVDFARGDSIPFRTAPEVRGDSRVSGQWRATRHPELPPRRRPRLSSLFYFFFSFFFFFENPTNRGVFSIVFDSGTTSV